MSSSTPALRRRAAAAHAEEFGGVLSRLILRGLGVDRRAIAREVAGDRWRLHGEQTVALHTQPLSVAASQWRAVWETGHRIAALDGVSALAAADVTGYEDPRTHVSVPRPSTPPVPPM